MLQFIIKGVIKIRVIYIDLLFLVNFVINTLVLLCQALFMKIPAKASRIALGAGLGAVYACLVFLVKLSFLSSSALRILFSLAMTLTAFGFSKIRALLKRVFVFYCVNFIFALLMLGILYFTDLGMLISSLSKYGVFYFNIPTGYLFLICGIAFLFTLWAEVLLKRYSFKSYVKLTIIRGEKAVHLTALTDSGNLLFDPISRKRVIVAESSVLKSLFDFDIEASAKNFRNLPLGFHLVPYSSIGNSKGLLLGFVPEKIYVDNTPKSCFTVCIFCGTLSQSGDYNALIGPIERTESSNAKREIDFDIAKTP